MGPRIADGDERALSKQDERTFDQSRDRIRYAASVGGHDDSVVLRALLDARDRAIAHAAHASRPSPGRTMTAADWFDFRTFVLGADRVLNTDAWDPRHVVEAERQLATYAAFIGISAATIREHVAHPEIPLEQTLAPITVSFGAALSALERLKQEEAAEERRARARGSLGLRRRVHGVDDVEDFRIPDEVRFPRHPRRDRVVTPPAPTSTAERAARREGNEQRVLAVLRRARRGLPAAELRKRVKMGDGPLRQTLAHLVNVGVLQTSGTGKNTRYFIKSL